MSTTLNSVMPIHGQLSREAHNKKLEHSESVPRSRFEAARVFFAPVSMVTFVVCVIFFAMTMPAEAASAPGNHLVVDVPFDFYCGNHLLPAGKYNVDNGMPASATISVQAVGGRVYGSLMGIPERSESGSAGPLLRFTRYPDGKSYLREIQNPFASSSYFPKSRIEREAARVIIGEGTSTGVASVSVAAK